MAGRYKPYPEYKDSGVEWLGPIPKHWGLTRIKFVTQCLDGARIPLNAQQRGDMQGDVPYWGANSVVDHINGYLFDEDLILLGEDGAPFFDKTKEVAFNVSGKIWPNNHVHVLRPNRKIIENRFLRHAINCADFHLYISGSTRDKLNQSDMNQIYVRICGKEEQEKIANFLDYETAKIDTLIEKQQQLIHLLKEKRQAVISHAVTKGLNPNAKMKDSGVEWLGEVPEGWTVCKIKQVAKLESGHTPDKKIEAYWVDCDIPWVSLNDSSQLKEVDYISDTAIYLNDKGIANSSARKLPERCVVFTRDASIGLAAITTRVMAVSQHVIAWICDEEKVIPEYLLLIFYAMKDELERYTFGATLKTIGMPDVNKLAAAFPDIKEQKQIIDHVFKAREKFDLLIRKAEDAIKIIKERRTALISAAVTGKIDVRNRQASNEYQTNKEVAA